MSEATKAVSFIQLIVLKYSNVLFCLFQIAAFEFSKVLKTGVEILNGRHCLSDPTRYVVLLKVLRQEAECRAIAVYDSSSITVDFEVELG